MIDRYSCPAKELTLVDPCSDRAERTFISRVGRMEKKACMCEKQVQRTDSNRNSDSSCSGWTLLIWYQHVVQRVVRRGCGDTGEQRRVKATWEYEGDRHFDCYVRSQQALAYQDTMGLDPSRSSVPCRSAYLFKKSACVKIRASLSFRRSGGGIISDRPSNRLGARE